MANEIRTSSSKGEKAKVQRTNVPWVTVHYDDEAILIAVRSSHPVAKWKEIQRIFNCQVPEKRRRILEAIYSKAKLICSAYHSPEKCPIASDAIESGLLPANTVSGNIYLMLLHSGIYGNLLPRQLLFRRRHHQRT